MTGNVRFDLWRELHPHSDRSEYSWWIQRQMRRAANQPGSGVITFGKWPSLPPSDADNWPHIMDNAAFDRWLKDHSEMTIAC